MATVEESERLLLVKSTANEGWNMLQQLVDNGDYQATFLMSRIYFDASVTEDNKGNEFYNPDWKIMRENCGQKADNVKAHNLLMKAYRLNENDIVMLYELGCDFLYFRGTENGLSKTQCWEHAHWCFDQINNMTKEGDSYKKAIEEKLKPTSSKIKIKP